jgi:hypothetical protein
MAASKQRCLLAVHPNWRRKMFNLANQSMREIWLQIRGQKRLNHQQVRGRKENS